MSLHSNESSSSFSSNSFLVPQVEGRSMLNEEGKLVGEDLPKDRTNFEFFQLRELGMIGSNKRSLEQRAQYASIPPNQTLYDVPTEFAFAKRFSPCGRYLICFGKDVRSVLVYAVEYHCKSTDTSKFDDFFRLVSEIPLPCPGDERVCRDFCMFVEGPGNLMILAGASTNRLHGNVRDTSRWNSIKTAHSLPVLNVLEDYSYWLVDYETGKIVDQLSYELDMMMLQHHSGASLCGTRFAVTSMQHQIVRIFHIRDNKLVLENVVGPNFYMDDPKWDPELIIGIKQKLVAFLYDEACNAPQRDRAILQFHRNLPKLLSMAIWKAQFFDNDHLIIKMCPMEQFATKFVESPSVNSSLLFWHIPTGRIAAFYTDADLPHLYDVCRVNNEEFRFGAQTAGDANAYLSNCGLNFTSCPSNSLQDRYLLDRSLEMLATAKGSSVAIGKTKLARAIPYNSQLMPITTSPFFDYGLFRYDDRTLSAIDRVRSCNDSSARIFSRSSGQVRIKLTSNPSSITPCSSRSNKWQHWIIHPHLPLVISLQGSNFATHCNIHYHRAQ